MRNWQPCSTIFSPNSLDPGKTHAGGRKLNQELIAQVQSQSQVIMKDPLAFEYFRRLQRFTLLVNDVYNILGEVIKFDEKA
jgi:hypothetical protein